MNHPEVRRRMGEYLQGDLTLAQRALVDAHLDGCEECAADLRALRDTVHLLRDLPAPEAPPHLADRVVARIADGEGRSRWWDGPLAFWNWIDPARYLPPLAGAALTSAVVIVGVRDLGWQIPGFQVPPKSEAASEYLAPKADVDTRMQPRPARRAPALAADEGPMLRGRARAGAPAAPAAPAASAVEEAPAEPEVLYDPHLFIERYRAVQAERREAWLRQMAARAARNSEVEAVARRLREDAGPEGRLVADEFEAVAYPAGR